MHDYGLTASRLSTFNACKRKHYFSYELGVRKDAAHYLSFGHALHEGLDQLKQGADVNDAAQATMAAFGDIFEDDDKALAMTQAAILVRYWHTRWASDPFTVIATEQAFSIPMPTSQRGRKVRRWRLRGKIDGIVELPDGRLAILEHKTTSQVSDAYWQRLELDEQLTVYTIAARSLGYNVQTVLYDVIRKPNIKPKKDEQLGDYAKRLAEDISTRPDFYYFRREIARLDDTLAEGVTTLNQVARDINHARIHGHHYRNSNACRSPYPCPYLGVCSSGINLEETIPLGFHKTETTHPELETDNASSTTTSAATRGSENASVCSAQEYAQVE